MASSKITGACNCGAIRVTLSRSSFPKECCLCHCLGCRASSGTLFSTNLVIPTKEVSIEGKPKVYRDSDTASGHTTGRNFRGDCGSPIMSIVEENPDVAFVKGGLFCKAGTELPPPNLELFWKRKEAWEVPAKGAKVID